MNDARQMSLHESIYLVFHYEISLETTSTRPSKNLVYEKVTASINLSIRLIYRNQLAKCGHGESQTAGKIRAPFRDVFIQFAFG